MNRFKIKSEYAGQFENQWRTRTSYLSSSPGFMRFRFLRQPSPQNSAHVEFVSYTEWIDQNSFTEWMNGPNAKASHSQNPQSVPRDAYLGPPEFSGYTVAIEETLGHRTDFRSPYLDQIVEKHFANESAEQKEIPSKCKTHNLPPINISAFEGRILELWLKAAQCKKGVEIGTLGGYSTSWLARGLAKGGKIYTLELDPKRSAIAQENLKFLESKGVEVVFISGPALDSLVPLEKEGPFDFVFIDADKAGYPHYAKWAISNLRPGGLILCDNAYIWGGMNQYPRDPDSLKYPKSQESLFSYSKNEYKGMSECWNVLAQSPLLDSTILPTGEGLGISIKR